jgi:hypothetical protein
MATEALRKEPLTLNFKEDTLTTVSRPMLRAMASKPRRRGRVVDTLLP